MDVKAYERCKKEIAKSCKTTYFTKDFFKTYEKDRALYCLCGENFENVKKTDFYQKNGTAYCRFLEAYAREYPCPPMRMILFTPMGKQFSTTVTIGEGTFEDLYPDECKKVSLIRLLSEKDVQHAILNNGGIDTFMVCVRNPQTRTQDSSAYSADDLMYFLEEKEEFFAENKAVIEDHFKKRGRSVDRE